jgi:hypothetical protein
METTPTVNHTKDVEGYFNRQITQANKVLAFINENREILEKLNLRFNDCGNFIDFDNLQRPDVTKVLLAFKTKWDKSPGYNGGLHYSSKETFRGFNIRCYNGEPPPTCKIVETVKYVKIPAKRERIVTRTVVCSDGSEKVLS